MKKVLIKGMVVASLGMMGAMTLTTSTASATGNVSMESVENFGLTQEEMDLIDKELDKQLGTMNKQNRSVTVAGVIGIVTGAIAIIGASYAAGKYAARQCQVRLGLTSGTYKANRWVYRGAIVAINPFVALGFDDYFYGI